MHTRTRIDTPNPTTRNVAIRYDQASIIHTSQFLLSPGDEELVVDLSSGLIRESTANETLPIHTRLSMSWSTAARLAELMNQVVQHHRETASRHAQKPAMRSPGTNPKAAPMSAPVPKFPQASIPTFDANQGTA